MDQLQRVPDACTSVSYLVLGMLDNNVYIVEDDAGCFVVDPTCDAERIVDALGERPLDAIVITHGHGDHVGAAAELRALTGAQVIASSLEVPYIEGRLAYNDGLGGKPPCVVDRVVEDGDVLDIGGMSWHVMATPGHTAGEISLYLPAGDSGRGAPVLIAGDVLFAGTHGRVDLEGGSLLDMRDSLVKLSTLPGETKVLPGHGKLTTIARESGWLRLCAV